MWPKQHRGVNKSTWPLTLSSSWFEGEARLVRHSGAKHSQSPSATLPLWGCHVTPPSHGAAHKKLYHKVHGSIWICLSIGLLLKAFTWTRLSLWYQQRYCCWNYWWRHRLYDTVWKSGCKINKELIKGVVNVSDAEVVSNKLSCWALYILMSFHYVFFY